MKRSLPALLLGLALAAVLAAQDEPPAQTPQQGGSGGGGRGGAAAAIPDPQPYDRVITKDAKTTKGVFTVHQIKERYYYEIPKSELGRDYLWNTQIAKTTVGVGYGGGELTNRVVRWELKGNRVLLLDVNYSITADPKNPIAMAVKAANNDTIIQAFPVAAFAKDGAPGDRGHPPVHQRRAGIQRAPAPGRHRCGCHALLHRAHRALSRRTSKPKSP